MRDFQILPVGLLLGIMLLPGCELIFPDQQKNPEDLARQVNVAKVNQDLKAYSVPSPMQIPAAIKYSGLEYMSLLLEPHHRDDAYPSNFSRAISLGMYYVDLGYVTMFNQTDNATQYLKAMNRLARQTGADKSLNDRLLARFESNIDVQDSLIQMILTSFEQTHIHLAEIRRTKLAVLMFAGCFIEGLHFIANATIESGSNYRQMYLGLIQEQKFYLENLLTLLQKYCRSIEGRYLISRLKEIQRIYDGDEYTFESNRKISRDLVKRIKITDIQISKIIQVVGKIRKDIIN